jgi:hypothetical protein
MKHKNRLLLIIGMVNDDYYNLDDDEYIKMIHERDRRIPCIALLDPQASPWEWLYVDGRIDVKVKSERSESIFNAS